MPRSKHHVQNVTIVLVPCTDAYIRFHDSRTPGDSYAKIRSDLARECANAGVTFVDDGEPISQYADFFDGYHLNDSGAAHFTSRLIAHHVVLSASDVGLNQGGSTPVGRTC